jgi:hypothetical protein
VRQVGTHRQESLICALLGQQSLSLNVRDRGDPGKGTAHVLQETDPVRGVARGKCVKIGIVFEAAGSQFANPYMVPG